MFGLDMICEMLAGEVMRKKGGWGPIPVHKNLGSKLMRSFDHRHNRSIGTLPMSPIFELFFVF